MHAIFKALGFLLLVYTVIAIARGQVYAKSGVWGRVFDRAESPREFWSVIVVYLLLSASLVFVF